jgi:hypothetical protein
MPDRNAAVCPAVGNDVDVQLRRQLDQPLCQGRLPERGALDPAPAQHDFSDARQTGELRDLLRHIIAVDRFDGRPQPLGQMQVGLEPCFILLRHPLKRLGFHK